MKFSPKCRTKKLGMIYTILGSFCSFLNWEGVGIRPQIVLGKALSSSKGMLFVLIRLASMMEVYENKHY